VDLTCDSKRIFGHASPTVLREHGLGVVTAAVDGLNAISEPSHEQAGRDADGDTESSDGRDNFLDDSSTNSGSGNEEKEEVNLERKVEENRAYLRPATGKAWWLADHR
jgi:hypothetical protein